LLFGDGKLPEGGPITSPQSILNGLADDLPVVGYMLTGMLENAAQAGNLEKFELEERGPSGGVEELKLLGEGSSIALPMIEETLGSNGEVLKPSG
jgi:hypothetical protein